MAVNKKNTSTGNNKKREEDLASLFKPQQAKVPFSTPGTDSSLEADLMDIYRDPSWNKKLDSWRENNLASGAAFMDKRYKAEKDYRNAMQQQALQAGGGTAMDTYQGVFKNNNVTVTPNTFGSYWDKYQNAINSGAFDEGDDYTKWSPKKVDDRIKELQEEIANITNLQTGALTEEEKAKKKELDDLWALKGKNTPIWNMDLGKQVTGRTQGGQNQSEYDKALYDQIHGDGAYDRRVGELKTKADIDAFKHDIDELWDRFENVPTPDGLQASKQELSDIWGQKGKYTALDMGQENIYSGKYGEIPKKPEDYYEGNMREEYDKLLYDTLYGDGAYEDRVEALKDADVDKFEAEMDDLWARYDSRNTGIVNNPDSPKLYQIADKNEELNKREEELNQLLTGAPKMKKELEDLQNWQKQYETIQKYEAKAAGMTVPEDWKAPEQKYLTGGNNRGQQLLNIMTGPQGEKKTDKIWREINQERSAWGRLTFEEKDKVLKALGRGESIDLSGGGADDLFGAVGRHYFLMDDKQVQTFENYYKNGMEEEALAYMEALEQYYLQPAQTMYQQMVARQEAEGPNGWMYGAASILTRPMDGLMGLIGSGLALAGNKDAASANSGWYRGQAINDAIRGGRTEAWGQTAEDLLGEWARKPAEFLNGVFYSMADMTMAATTGTTAAGAGTKGANILTQFIMSSEAASSTMREQLEQHRDPTEAAIRSIGAGAIEWITEKYSIEQLLNPNVKEMLRSKNGLASFIAKNTIAEGTEEGASDVLNIGLDVILSGVYGHENEIEEAYNKYRAQGMTDDEATRAVLWDNLSQIGLDMLAGSLSGFLLSGSRAGLNAIDIRNEGRNIKSGSNTTAEGLSGMDQVLQLSLGMKEGTQSRALAEEIQKKIDSGKTPTAYEMGRLAQLTAVEAGEQQEALIRDGVERTIRESITSQGVSEEAAATYSAIITDSLMQGKSLTKEQMSVLSQSKAAMDVWKAFNTKIGATVLGMEARRAAAPSQSIINRLGDLTGQTNYGNSVIAAEIVRSSRETNSPAEAIDNLAQRRSDLMSAEYATVAKEVLQSDKKIVNKARFLDDAMKIRLAAMTLNEKMPQTGMSEESAQKLYKAAQDEFNAIDEQRIRNQVQVKPGEGWAKFNGAEYGTAAFDEATKDINRHMRNQMKIIGEVVTRLGARVTFINDEDNPGIFGYEQSDGSITINIAGKHRSGLSHHMMVTLSHELTHWLEQNSREGYNQLRKFVLDSLRAKGTNIEQLIVSSIDNQNAVLGADSGESLTINGAMAEIVARSCENLLSSQAMADELAKTNPSLYSKVKSFVKNFVARMREAVKGMNSSLSYEARALLNETEKIARIWLGAREEALGRETTEGTEDVSSEVVTSYSMDQTAKALQQDLELKDGPETHYGDYRRFSVEVKDPEELRFLNNQETVKTYKSMQLINGKLYPPMAAVVAGSMEDASQLGHWEKATEHPELIKSGNQFTLNKGGGKGSLNAAYNPYMHSSNLMINDQFSGAYDRPNLVTVECEVPVSELDSGYHAEFAKDSVGWHKWHTGTVAGQLRKQKGVERQVMLSRWIKPVRIVPNEEVAAHYKEMIDGTDIQVPDNVVPPALLEELRKAGVPIKESGKVQYSTEQLDAEYQAAVERGDLQRATDMLMDRLAETEGIIPFNAPHGYGGQHKDIAKLIKEGTPEAVARAAADMARFVPENGVLIPMPPHEGTVKADTDTMILANAIGKLTGRPVVVALASDPRESRYKAKSEGRKGVSAAEMGFRQVAEIPEGSMPIFVDNVVGSGVTADAARTAMGGGITLAYAKGTQSKGIEGLKRATVTYDSNGKPIPLSQRFDRSIRNVNYSVEQGDAPQEIENDQGESMATLLPGNTVAATQYSLESYRDMGERQKMFSALKKAGYSEQQIKKWLDSLDSVANIIASDRTRYDFIADRSKKFLKDNGDVYKKTLDASTMCKKTRLYNGTFNLVQHMLPNTILMPEDLIDLFNLMKDRDLETPCGICYVQSRRRQLGPYTEEWLSKYKGEYIPTVDEVTTSDGLERLKEEHPQAYTDFVKAMNKKGVNNPKLVQQRTDYRGEIRDMRPGTIEYLKNIGGLRIQSFSDFEVVHMLDMMQAVMDMKARGLTAQAYTKVPEFAWVFGPTGIKINLSLIGKGTGLDAEGNLVFDNDEGMNFDEAMKLREAYSKNVGTILVGINDDHIIAAMGDSRIDFIIPFHKSGWSEKELGKIRTLKGYWDYTNYQNEYRWTTNENGERVLEKMESNIDPLSYWQFDKSGEENARIYLEECRKQGLVPKFRQFLTERSDGSYTLPDGTDRRSTNIREGYWKTLIDFKMYDNQRNGSRQTGVEPNFNMDEAYKILKEYDGSHRELPENREVAEEYVRRYKEAHPLDNVRRQYSMEDAPDMDVNAWMAGLTPGSLQTEDERALHQAWKDLRMSFSLSIKRQLDYRAKIKRLESLTNPTKEERADLVALRNRLQDQEENQARLEKKIAEVTSREGFAGMMYEHNMRLKDTIAGRTQDEVNNTVEDMVHEVQKMAQEIAEAKRELEKIAEQEGVKQAETFLKKTQLGEYAKSLKKDYRSKMTEGEIRSRMAEMALRIAQGETVDDILDSASELAYDLARMQTGYQGAYGDAAERLKKATIVIGQTQYEQLRAQHSSIPELRRQLAGTGVKIVYDKNLRGAGTLEDIGPGSEIHDLLPELGDDTGNMMDNLDKFLSVARSIRENIEKEMIHDFDLQDATDMIRGFAMLGAAEMKGNPAMATHIRRLLGLQKADGGKAGELAERLANAQAYMGNALEKGDIAKGLTRMLKKDVDSAIDYYNKIAAVAAKEEKRKVREGLIKQLKSEHGQALLREQMKWRELIEKDKTVREKMASNHKLRQWITTDYSRIRKLLINETDQKNIPEHMKSLARYMLKMLTENDMIGRKITEVERADLKETLRVLGAMKETDAEFTPDDLKAINDEEVQAAVADALADLEDGIKFYNASPGSDRISNLQAFHNALDRIHGAVDTIYSVIKAQQSISFMDRQILVADAAEDIRRDMGKSRFKGELKGRGSKAIRTAKNAVVYGNMTPVYFIKNLLNKGMDEQWKEIERGENQYGLEARKAETYVADLAERTGYSSWSNQKLKVTLGGNERTISIENAMELYAIWRREQTTNPEMSQHLTKGGVVINEEEETGGKLQREHKEMRPIRVTDGEILAMYDQLTDEQKAYIEGMVKYLSSDMSDLGNAASMRMYGIKKYKEKYYFPMKVWDGVKSARSDKGISGTDENRAAHKSWSKRRQNLARNALVIGNFTKDAVNHIVEMITYNTMAPAIENLNRVLNFQFTEGMTEDDITKRNLRIMFAENYGKDALNYLETFMNDLNGGAVQDQRKTLRDRMLAIFKKNAVAGSLSVALQQPLSYVRAAMMINPKYLAQALNPKYWKGSHEEMTKYSGVAVIKDMGRFDMNFGQSAADSIMPEGAKTKGRAAYEWLSDKTTMLPEMMDRMTWTRMWSAVKAEQAAQNPGMDVKSDEFLQKCAERFNDVMRKTQVYDSVLVKSSNMRSQNLGMKVMTSFMAEPTLTLNVLADAVRNVNLPGGKAVLAKAGATYVLSAVFQALVKAAMGTGRSPDKKKTIEENILNKFMQSFMGEVNPMSLIPGYSDLIEVLKTGELQDDAMGALGKLKSIVETTQKAIQGKQDDVYRGLEDTVGQLAQLFTNIPAKNIMRDVRAMWNWAVVRPYADRATSGAVLKEQSMANFMTGDNLLGVMNSWLGDAGYQTTNASYYDRMMQAREAGDAEREDELHEYLTLARGVTDKTISQEMRKRMKASSVLTPEEKIKQLREDGMKDTDIANWIVDEYEAGNLTKTEAEKLYVQANPKKDANDAYFMFERKEQEKETGESVTGGDYYKLDEAIAKGDTAAATAAAKDLTAHGYTSEDVNDHAKDYITKKYRAGEITNAQAKQALKTFRKDLDDVDIFWMLDRIDYKNETGKSAGSGKYYRLDAAIEANKAAEITRAVTDMMKYGGYDKEGVLKGIRYFKKTYLAAEGNEKIKLRDALTKAFKAAGMSATEATKEIDSWKPAKTKKKKTK